MSTAESEKISSEGGMSPVGDVNRKYLKGGQSMEEEASRLRLVLFTKVRDIFAPLVPSRSGLRP